MSPPAALAFTLGVTASCMRRGILVALVFACGLRHHCISCCGFERTHLAQNSAQAETTCEDLCELGIWTSSGKRKKAESPPSCEEAPAPSQLEPEEFPFASSSSFSNDMVLQAMPGPKRTQIRYVQIVQTTLDGVLGTQEEIIPLQECTQAEREDEAGTFQESRRSYRNDCDRSGPLDRNHTSSTASWSEENGSWSGGGSRLAAATTANVAPATDQTTCSETRGRGIHDTRRTEVAGKSAFPQEPQSSIIARTGRDAVDVGEESEGSVHGQESHTCPHQQVEQTPGQGRCSRKENLCSGPGMVQVCSKCAGPNSVPCSQVPPVQTGAVADLPGSEAGAGKLQTGGRGSIEDIDGLSQSPNGASRRSHRPGSDDSGHVGRSFQCQRQLGSGWTHRHDGRPRRSAFDLQRGRTGDGDNWSHEWRAQTKASVCRVHIASSCGQQAGQGEEGDSSKACVNSGCTTSDNACSQTSRSHEHDLNRYAQLSFGEFSFEPRPHKASSKKVVSFHPQVEVIAWHGQDVQMTQVPIEWCESWLRSFWTIEGHTSQWTGLIAAFQQVNQMSAPWFRSCMLQGEHITLAHGSRRIVSTGPSVGCTDPADVQLPRDMQNVGSVDEAAFKSLQCTNCRFKNVETWFLAYNRFHVCAESRRLRIAEDWDVQDFRTACRALWVDLIGPDDFVWYRVDEPAHGLSPQAKVIIAQGIRPDQMVSLLHFEGYPVLRKHRALLFTNGSPAVQVLREAALTQLCNSRNMRCQIEYGHPWQREVVSDDEPVLVVAPTILYAKAMVLDDSDGQEGSSDEEASEDLVSTHAPSDRSEDLEDDALSLMSPSDGHLGLQPFPPAQTWEPPVANLVAEQAAIEEDDEMIGIVEAQWEEIVECHSQTLDAVEDDTFQVVTFGLGLVSLGRRDATIQSRDIEVMLGVIADLWADHAQFAPLRVILVRPQPQILTRRNNIVFIVEIQYVPEHDPLRQRAVLIQEAGDEAMIRNTDLYPVWTGHRGNSHVLLSSIQRDADVYPNSVRRVTVLRGEQIVAPDQWIEFQDGDFCTVHFESFPRHVAVAQQHVHNAELLFLDLQHADEITHNECAFCLFHGISPSNVPLGSRVLCIPFGSFIRGAWYEEAKSLWPFGTEECNLAYSWMENTASSSDAVPSFTFHFVASYRRRFHQVPILVQQIIYAIEDCTSHTEAWAIEVDSNARPDQLPSLLQGFRWWHNYIDFRARVHLRYPFSRLEPGATVEVTLHTHRRFNVAMFLLQDRRWGNTPVEEEQISLLQRKAVHFKPHRIIEALAASFDEIVENICAGDRLFDSKTEANANLRSDIGQHSGQFLDDLHSDLSVPQAWLHRSIDQVSEDEVEDIGLLPPKEVQLGVKIVDETKTKRTETYSGSPVAISLDACLPHDRSNSDDPDGISLQWFEKRNWYDFCIQQDALELHPIPDGTRLKASTYRMLTRDEDWIAVPTTYLIFIDGSANDHAAAWSVVVVATDGWTQSLVGTAYGQVKTCSQDVCWTGADHCDNISAELTALLYAQNWVFKRNDQARYVILPDLQLSKLLSQNVAVCRTHPNLVRLTRLYSDWIQDRCSYVHVKGHDSYAWNELADSIAGHALQAELESPGAQLNDIHELVTNGHDLKWIWMQDSTDTLSSCFPSLINEQAVNFGHSLRRVATLPSEEPPCLEVAQLAFKALTANVLALDTTNEANAVGRSNAQRTARLDQQWNGDNVALVGVQEARTAAGRFQSENYTIISSGADHSHTATHGCELWIHKTLSVAQLPSGKKIKLAESAIVVQHASPRRLFVKLEQDAFSICVVVLHAPCKRVAGDPDGEVSQWWEDTANMYLKFVGHSRAVVLVDANGPLTSQPNEQIGDAGSEAMNIAGEAFESFIMTTGLYAPTTMPWCHRGQHTTWTHPKGAKRRIDYILVTEDILQMTSHTQVLTAHDTTFSHEDHLPVLLCCQGLLPIRPPETKWKWDFDKMKDPTACRNFQEALMTMPIPTWNVHVDDHCAIYERQILQLGRQFFRKQGRSRRRPQLQDSTVEAIRFKRSCLDFGRRTGSILHEDFKQELKAIEKDVRKLVCKDIRSYFDGLLDEMEKDSLLGDFRAVYRALTRFGSKKSKQPSKGRPLPLLEKPDGSFATSFKEFQEIWLRQFSEVEAGEPIQWSTLQKINRGGLGLPVGEHDPLMFPDEMQLTMAISRLKRGKVPGPNQLPTDLIRAGQPVIAKQLTALCMKSASSAREPLTWKGGYVCPLYKKGPMAKPSSYRSIFISDVTAKLYHGSIRESLLRTWQAALTHQQLGGRPRCGADSAHHWVQAHDQWTTFHRLVSGYVFFDLKSAFYTVLREALTDQIGAEEFTLQALVRLGIHPGEAFSLLQTASESNATAGISTHASKVVKDLMTNTFFKLRNNDTVVHTRRGTRPGDPVADLLFNMCMKLILEDVTEMVAARSQAIWIGCTTKCASFEHSGPIPLFAYFDVSYVDDMVFALHGACNDEVEALTQVVVESVCKASAKRGLLVNFDQGKTEMIWNIRGPGSRAVRSKLASRKQKIEWLDEAAQQCEIRVVPAYKHLGTWLQTGAKHGKEVKARQSAAAASWGPLIRTFYAKKQVSPKSKTKVFQSLTLSRHVFNAHVWCGVTKAQLQAWQNSIRKPVAAIVRHELSGLPNFKFGIETLTGLAHMMTPIDTIHAARLRYLKRLIPECPQTLWSLIWDARGSKDSWIDAVRESLEWLCYFCPNRLPLTPEADFADWITFIMMDTCWKGKIKAAVKSCTAFRHENAKQRVWQAKFEDTLLQHDVQIPEAEVTKVDGHWQCDLCQSKFVSKCALAMHAHKAHGYKCLTRYFALGDTCLACNKLYHCRPRLRSHLTTSVQCLDKLQALFPPCSEEQASTHDEEDRARTKCLKDNGWWATKAFEPPMQVHGPGLPDADSVAASEMKAKMLARFGAGGEAFQALQGHRTMPTPDHVDLRPAPDDDLPPVIMHSEGGTQHGTGQFSVGGLADIYAKLHVKCLVAVHFFSGFRRTQDLHEVICETAISAGVMLYTLSIDICMQKQDANLCGNRAMRFWCDRISSGQVIAAGGGPPCETFSAARHQPGGPPPLRDQQNLMGLPALKAKQWKQVAVGSELIRFTCQIMLQLALCGACGFCEHPQWPSWIALARPASIWTMRAMRLLKSLACTQVTSFDQCVFQASLKKPTTIMTIRLGNFRREVLRMGHKGRCCHPEGHTPLKGRDSDGSFMTARAKIYPPALNLLLGRVITTFAAEKHGNFCSEELPSELKVFCEDSFADSRTVQPDYHG